MTLGRVLSEVKRCRLLRLGEWYGNGHLFHTSVDYVDCEDSFKKNMKAVSSTSCPKSWKNLGDEKNMGLGYTVRIHRFGARKKSGYTMQLATPWHCLNKKIPKQCECGNCNGRWKSQSQTWMASHFAERKPPILQTNTIWGFQSLGWFRSICPDSGFSPCWSSCAAPPKPSH